MQGDKWGPKRHKPPAHESSWSRRMNSTGGKPEPEVTEPHQENPMNDMLYAMDQVLQLPDTQWEFLYLLIKAGGSEADGIIEHRFITTDGTYEIPVDKFDAEDGARLRVLLGYKRRVGTQKFYPIGDD